MLTNFTKFRCNILKRRGGGVILEIGTKELSLCNKLWFFIYTLSDCKDTVIIRVCGKNTFMCWRGGVTVTVLGTFPKATSQVAISQMYTFPNDNFPRGNFLIISELTIFKEKRQYLSHYYSDEGLNWYFWESGLLLKWRLQSL